MVQRTFHRFRHHRRGTFHAYNAEKRALHWTPEGASGAVDDWIQHGIEFDWNQISPGDTIRVQDGETTNFSSAMRGGGRYLSVGRHGGVRRIQAYTGYSCIAQIGHNDPKVSLLALRCLEHAVGAQDAAIHLAHYRDGASTLQREAEMKLHVSRRINPYHSPSISFSLAKGRLRATYRIANAVLIEHDRVSFPSASLPDTAKVALVGRPASALVGHPTLMDARHIVNEIREGAGETSWLVLADPLLTVEEAIACLRTPLPLAA